MREQRTIGTWLDLRHLMRYEGAAQAAWLAAREAYLTEGDDATAAE